MVGLVPQGGTSGPTAGDWSKAKPMISAAPAKSEGDGYWSSVISIFVLDKEGRPFPGAPVKVRMNGNLVKELETDDAGWATYTASNLTPGKYIFEMALPAGKPPKAVELNIKLITLFDLGDANLEKDKDTWSMVGTIQVKDGNDIPAKRHTVDIRMDNNPPITVDTDENGVAVYTFTGIEKGNHTFSATPTGSTTPMPRHKKFESDKAPKKAAKILIQHAESGGAERRIRMSVLTEDNTAVKNAVVTVTDLDEPEKLFEAKSDENGKAEIVITLRSGRNRISFMVLNSSIMEERFLYV